MGNPFERWPGYNEQSWQERFAELDLRHSALHEQIGRMFIDHPLTTKPVVDSETGFDDTQAAELSNLHKTQTSQPNLYTSPEPVNETGISLHEGALAGSTEGWKPIGTCMNQTEVLVCNDCLLGWHAVAIQDALGGWHYADSRGRLPLKYEPTHWQALPSVHPIALPKGRAHAN